MLFKVLLCFCLLQVIVSAKQSGSWIKLASDRCIGPKGGHYKQITYYGSSTFIIAMRLVHTRGSVGCYGGQYSRWGCNDVYPINIFVTDPRNKVIYPSPTLVSIRPGGWYELPGYGPHASQLVFSDPGFRYLHYGQRIRIWYGEDLYNWAEHDNHGFTCMDVYVYSPNF